MVTRGFGRIQGEASARVSAQQSTNVPQTAGSACANGFRGGELLSLFEWVRREAIISGLRARPFYHNQRHRRSSITHWIIRWSRFRAALQKRLSFPLF